MPKHYTGCPRKLSGFLVEGDAMSWAICLGRHVIPADANDTKSVSGGLRALIR